MSCNAPIDLTSGSVGKCELKCEYAFEYQESNCTITNMGNSIQLSYDQSSIPEVEYNNTNYQVRKVQLFTPSLHKYNGSRADGEMLIFHSSGGKNLIVSIPIIVSSSKTKTTRFFNQVADYVRNFVPNVSQTASMGNATYNLNDFVPEKSYYSYSGTLPYSPCNGDYQYVVFSTDDMAQATISQNALDTFKRYISTSNSNTRQNTYYRSQGPAKAGLGQGSEDDIYISCQPTGQSETQEAVRSGEAQSDNFFTETGDFIKSGKLVNNPFSQFAIAALIMIGVYKIGTLVFSRGVKKSS